MKLWTNCVRACGRLVAISLVLGFTGLPGLAADTLLDETHPLRPELEQLEEELFRFRNQLESTTVNAFGVRIPAAESPQAIAGVVRDLHRWVGKWEEFGTRAPVVEGVPGDVQDMALDALKILYKGRGNTVPKDGKGWFLANRSGATGVTEIQDILWRGLLDDDGIQRFEKFVTEYEFTAEAKKAAGFPPQFDIGSDAVKNDILATLRTVPRAKPYLHFKTAAATNRPIGATEKLIDEAVDAGKLDEATADYLKGHFLPTLENNLFDSSTKVMDDPTKQFINYFGRDAESRAVLDAFTKLEKGHVLMTGKAGVGKTTILKILSDGFVQGKLKVRDEAAPLILELPITSVTNPSDPSEIKSMVKMAEELSKAIDRRIILYVDEAHISTSMTRNALKGFLTNLISPVSGEAKVNIVFSTTSQESRTFLEDSAFSRRFTEVHVPEFNRDETIQLVKQAYEPLWKKHHKKGGWEFGGIDDDAYEYAYRFAGHEQPHAGNPTGTKEILESAITRKMNTEAGAVKGAVRLTAKDLQEYLRAHLKLELVPGDPEFDAKFEQKWAAFEQDYVGNEGTKAELKQWLKGHFARMKKDKMTAGVFFGPPGAGKNYAVERLAEHFTKGAVLTINGGEYKEGGLGLNKLIGSPTGTVGSEEQRSILTKFFKDNPTGGFILIDEADYIHQDVLQLLTSMITDQKLTDGLGKEWKTGQYVIVSASNIGQDHMIPKDAKNRMNWEQFETRRRQLTEKAVINGKEVERVRPEKLEGIFDQFAETIVTKSNPGGDTSLVAQEANKQKRRYRSFYIMPPTREELRAGAIKKVEKFKLDMKAEFGVTFDIAQEVIDKVIDLDHYKFEMGHSYVNDQISDKLIGRLSAFLSERGQTIKVGVEDATVNVGGRALPSRNLVVQKAGGEKQIFSMGAVAREASNPWGDNPAMMDRLKRFSGNMQKHIKGNGKVIQDMKQALLLKAADWSTRPVFTLLGTTGNGKTETFKAMAKVLFDDENAMFKISGLTDKYKLGNFFRPPTGIQGGKEETQFERWFMSRKNSGGGIVLLDELLSFNGLSSEEISQRINVINELYDMLDEGYVRFGNRVEDARGFIIGVTGNAMQEAFKGIPDDPDAERQIQEVMARITRKDVTDYFNKVGMDPPKVARFGQIHVMGPQPRAVTAEVGKQMVESIVAQAKKKAYGPLEVAVDEKAIKTVVNEMTTIELGMREVNRGFTTLIKEPLENIRTYFPDAKKIEMKMDKAQKALWFVDGAEVGLEAVPLGNGLYEENWTRKAEFAADAVDHTPQVKNLDVPKKLQFTEAALHTVAQHEVYGHWMTGAILDRKNYAQAISLIPGENYLGYVRKVQEELHDVSNLSSNFKDAVRLHAGHRAPFLLGNYEPGGGGSGFRDPKKMPSDDLGKVDRLVDQMASNRMLPGVNEQTPKETAAAKRFLMEVFDEAADDVIRSGMESGEFEQIYDHVVKRRFVAKEDLDAYVLEKVRWEKFEDADEFFLKKFSKALDLVSKRWKSARVASPLNVPEFSRQLLGRLFHEATAAAGDAAKVSKLKALENQALARFASGPTFRLAPVAPQGPGCKSLKELLNRTRR